MSRLVIAMLFAASLLGCPGVDVPPEFPDCTGGCAIGIACQADADCLFGSCKESTCAAPTGVAPTGPVTKTIPLAGEELTVVSAEGVTMKVTFPEGSVRAPLELTLTPQTPKSGWLSVSIEPPGVVLEKPATVTVTLPQGTTHAADASLRFVTPDDFELVPSSGGATLTGQVRSLGVPGILGGIATRTAFSLPSPASFLTALPLPLRAKVDIANLLLDALVATGRYRDAVELQATVADLLLHSNEPDFAAITGRLFDRIASTSCTALAAEIARMEAANPKCAAEQQFWFRPVMNWAVAMQSVDSRQATHCAALDEYLPAMGHAAELTIARIEADPGASIKCDCKWTTEARWGTTQQLVCPRLRPFDGLPALPAEDFGAVADAVELAHEDTQLSLLAGDAEASNLETDALARPFLSIAHDGAWETCRSTHDQTRFGTLLATVVDASPSDREALVADAHACAIDLDWQAFPHNGTTADASGTLAPTARGQAAPEGTIAVDSDGSIRLGGNVAALHCPNPARVESDEIFVKVVTPTATAEVARQTASANGNLLGSPLNLDVSTLYNAVGQDPATDPTLVFEVWRHSPGCHGLYGTSDVKLSTLTLGRGGGTIVFLRGDIYRSGNGKVCTIKPDGTGFRVIKTFATYDDGLAVGRPSISADGSKIVIGHRDFDPGRDFLEIVPIGAGAATNFDHGDTHLSHADPDWSPDGLKVVFKESIFSEPPGFQNLKVLDVATGQMTALTNLASGTGIFNPAWSPDGLHIAYSQIDIGGVGEKLMVMDANGQNAAQLAGIFGGTPDWSPDGTRIAYLGDTHVMIANVDGSNPHAVIPRDSSLSYLAWSPDSEKLVFDSEGATPGTTTISIVNVDGTGLLDLTHGTDDVYPSWSR